MRSRWRRCLLHRDGRGWPKARRADPARRPAYSWRAGCAAECSGATGFDFARPAARAVSGVAFLLAELSTVSARPLPLWARRAAFLATGRTSAAELAVAGHAVARPCAAGR